MTKQANIFYKIKANLWVLLVFCFALMSYANTAYAAKTYYAAPQEQQTSVYNASGAVRPTDLGCTKERMDSIYKSGCYACDVVTALVGSFMTACTYLYDVSKEAGSKILFIGTFLWIAFYIFKQLSSLKNIEPAAMVNEMLIMAFKVLGAYLVINAGVDFFINYAIVPFVNFGAEFGTQMLNSSQSVSGLDINNVKVESAYSFADGVVPASLMNNLLKYIAAVDYTVSTHLQIGHMLTCHSIHAGAYKWTLMIIPNIWLWLSGAFIWFNGFMMTLSVAYYLVDISFKLGFTIIALPITVGLWPFNITKGKLTACFSMILKSAGILIFLAMTVSAGLALVDAALDIGNETTSNASSDAAASASTVSPDKPSAGAERLMTAIENSDTEYVSEHFAFWGFSWIIILFAYLFALKLIGSTMTDYVDKFFPDQVMASAAPMHMQMTKMTDMAKKKAMKPVKFTGKVIAHQGGKLVNKAVDGIGRGIGKVATNFFMKKDKKDDSLLDKAQNINSKIDRISKADFNSENKNQNKKQSMAESAKSMAGLDANKDRQSMEAQSNGDDNGGSGGGAGKAMQQGGRAMKESGRQIKETADSLDQNLANADQSQKAAANAAKGGLHMISGATMGISAPVTETAATATTAASTASSAALNAGRVAAKTMKATGEVMEKTGEMIEQAGKAVEKGEKVANKVANTAKKATGAVDKIADKVEKTGNDAMGTSSDGNAQSGDGGMISGAADQLMGTDNKKK